MRLLIATSARTCGTGAYLGAEAPIGNRDRLQRELDRLAGLGISNIRILGASELSPLKNSVRPAIRDKAPPYNEQLLQGLDFMLAEMGKRGMRAVIYVNNFWEWSGGMVTYLYWVNGGKYIDMNDPAHPWPEFPDFSAQFYGNAAATELSRQYTEFLVSRTNTVSGVRYRDDPAIMAWQLANEPRPGGSDAFGKANLPAFYAWIAATAKAIKALDPHHLVSTGSEGLKGCLESADCVLTEHKIPEIDYLTCHIWPQNWSWVDKGNLAGTYPTAEKNTKDYIAQHIGFAKSLGKPLVIEEFGFPRDDGGYEPGTPTTLKDKFYEVILSALLASAKDGGPLSGVNFWGWGGEGRAQHGDHHFERGDTSYMGDPPHEPQGWYSVFDQDASTIALLKKYAHALAEVKA